MRPNYLIYRDEADDLGPEAHSAARGDELKDDAADAAAAEAAEAAAAEKAAAEKAAAQAIPKARFDEAVSKEREKAKAAEQRAKDLEAKLAKQEEGLSAEKIGQELDALEDKLDAAIADNDEAAKKAIRAEIRAKNRELVQAEARRQGAYATAVAVEQVHYNALVAQLEATHPEVNPDSDQYDADVETELAELKAAYEATGMGSTDALKKAAKYIFKTAPEEVKKEKAGEKASEPTDEEKKVAAEKAAKLREEAVKRGLEAKGKQPAASADKVGKSADSRGESPDKPNVAKMSDKDFEKLTDEQKARMRGDFI